MSGVVVIGAGVVGLTVALTLAERGARSRSSSGRANSAATPLGSRAACWRRSARARARRGNVVELGKGAIDWWAARVPGVAREGTLVVAPPRDVGEIDRFAARTRGI